MCAVVDPTLVTYPQDSSVVRGPAPQLSIPDPDRRCCRCCAGPSSFAWCNEVGKSPLPCMYDTLVKYPQLGDRIAVFVYILIAIG